MCVPNQWYCPSNYLAKQYHNNENTVISWFITITPTPTTTTLPQGKAPLCGILLKFRVCVGTSWLFLYSQAEMGHQQQRFSWKHLWCGPMHSSTAGSTTQTCSVWGTRLRTRKSRSWCRQESWHGSACLETLGSGLMGVSPHSDTRVWNPQQT